MRIIRYALPLGLAVLGVSCSALQPKPDDHAAVVKMVHDQSQGLIRVVSYKKLYGVTSTEPSKTYRVQYQVEIEFLTNVEWSGPRFGGWGGMYCAERNGTSIAGILTDPKGTKGTYMRLQASITFLMTDRGWVATYQRCGAAPWD